MDHWGPVGALARPPWQGAELNSFRELPPLGQTEVFEAGSPERGPPGKSAQPPPVRSISKGGWILDEGEPQCAQGLPGPAPSMAAKRE
jgi:hypothetical protein